MLKKYFLLLTVFFCCHSLFTQEKFNIQVKPGVTIPVESSNEESLFNPGFIGQIAGQFNFNPESRIFANTLFSYSYSPTKADELSMNLLAIGGGPGIRFNLLPSLKMQTGLNLGWYLGIADGETTMNPFTSTYLDFSYAISPVFTLTLGSSYDYYLTNDKGHYGDLYQGVGVFIGAQITPGAKVQPADLDIQTIQFFPVFPVFHKYYNDNPLGSFQIRNKEKQSLYDLDVSFYVSQYMDAPREVSKIRELKAGECVEIPLYALFNMDIMDLTESSLSTAVINVSYTWQKKDMGLEIAESLPIQNRNAMIWDDDRKAASFVTSGDPYVLQFAKNVGGLVRESETSPVNINFRIAMGIFESLKDYGINYVVDPVTPYLNLSENMTAVDYLQFPRQTLNYKAGDCDDLTILYCSLLKAVGMQTAFITVPGHIYMAFNPGIKGDELKKSFNNRDDFFIIDDEVWVPVEITQIQDGFLNAWKTGARLWRENTEKNTLAFLRVDEAQNLYQPVGLRSEQLDLKFPGNDEILESYHSAFSLFLSRDIYSEEQQLQHLITSSGGNPQYINKLGTLYARYGMYDKASAQFEKLVRKEYAPALVNLGNISYLKRDYTSALNWFSRAAKDNPESTAVLVGLARTNYELENYAVVNRLYDKIVMVNSSAAERYSYLAGNSGGATRAGMQNEFLDMVWDEVEK